MVTTHYPELKLYGYNRPRTTNASMEFDLKTLSPTYHLQIGIPGHSNAFAIARKLGMREDVVKNAQNLMSDEDSDINKMITKLNTQTKAAAVLAIVCKPVWIGAKNWSKSCNKHLIGITNVYKNSLILHKSELMKLLPNAVKKS